MPAVFVVVAGEILEQSAEMIESTDDRNAIQPFILESKDHSRRNL